MKIETIFVALIFLTNFPTLHGQNSIVNDQNLVVNDQNSTEEDSCLKVGRSAEMKMSYEHNETISNTVTCNQNH